MRGQALSNTRKLNRHWQSGEGGGHYVDPYTTIIRVPPTSSGVPIFYGDLYVPHISNTQGGIISLYKKDNPSFISSDFFFVDGGTNLAALPINDGTNIFCSMIFNASEFNQETQQWDDFVRIGLSSSNWSYMADYWDDDEGEYVPYWYPANITARLRVLSLGDMNSMNFVIRETVNLENFYSSSEQYNTKTGTFSASILTAKYLKISLYARSTECFNSLIIPIPTVLANAQEIIRTSGVALPIGVHDVSETHNPPIWRQESAFLRMTLIDDTHISVTVFSVYGLAVGFDQRFDVSIDVWEEDPYS